MSRIGNLVQETTTSTGTGNLTVTAANGKRTFNTEFGTGATADVFYYFISHQSAAEWEIGTGHLSAATTFVRDTVIASSNADALVNFSSGTKDVVNDLPAIAQAMGFNTGTASITVSHSDFGKIVELTGSTARTFTFTAAATLGANWWCIVKNNSTAELTLDGNGSELDGLANYISYPGEVRLIQCTGSVLNSTVLHGFSYTKTASYTFTKPPGYLSFFVELWGAGGSGGSSSSSTTGGGGGGGGAYMQGVIIASALTATESVTVGAGGGSKTGNNNGSAGGNTTFDLLTAYGGGGGDNLDSGGGGGGALSAGALGGPINSVTPMTVKTLNALISGSTQYSGAGGKPYESWGQVYDATGAPAEDYYASKDATYGGGAGGMSNTAAGIDGHVTSGYGSVFGGGGGGAGGNATVAGGAGGGSVWGGAGGGGGSGDSAPGPGAGGNSIYGGNGGTGAYDNNTATTGSVPGGGGGGCETGGNSGAGGAGQVRITGFM